MTQGDTWQIPIAVPGSIPAGPAKMRVSPGLLTSGKSSSEFYVMASRHPNVLSSQTSLPQLTATNNSVRSGPAKAKPYGLLHRSTAKTSNSQSQWPPLPACALPSRSSSLELKGCCGHLSFRGERRARHKEQHPKLLHIVVRGILCQNKLFRQQSRSWRRQVSHLRAAVHHSP